MSSSTDLISVPSVMSVPLNTSDDWERWFAIIKSIAEQGLIWKYVNPDTTEKAPEASDPKYPTEKDDYHIKKYEHERRAFERAERIELAIGKLKTLIIQSTSKGFFLYTQSQGTEPSPSCRLILQRLRAAIAPARITRRMDFTNNWNHQKKYPHDKEVEPWLTGWINLEAEGRYLNMPEVQETRAQTDFLLALGNRYDFAPYWRQKLAEAELTSEPQASTSPTNSSASSSSKPTENQALSLSSLVNMFRIQRNERLAAAGRIINHSAYASTLQDEPIGRKRTSADGSKRMCVCGRNHDYADCWYISSNKAPSGWKPDPSRAERVKKAIKELPPRAAKKVKKMQQSSLSEQPGASSKATETSSTTSDATNQLSDSAFTATVMPSAFATARRQPRRFPLENSVILDPAATVHIFNSREWFIGDLTPTSDGIWAGKELLPVEGYGVAKVTLDGDYGPHNVLLHHAAYVPGYVVNLVSFRALKIKGVHYNTESNHLYNLRLTKDRSKAWAKMKEMAGQNVLHYRPLTNEQLSSGYGSDDTEFDSAFFSARYSRPPVRGPYSSRPIELRKDITSHGLLWHDRLGHAGPKAVSHLASAITGGKDVPLVEPSFTERETCALSKIRDQDLATQMKRPIPKLVETYDLGVDIHQAQQHMTQARLTPRDDPLLDITVRPRDPPPHDEDPDHEGSDHEAPQNRAEPQEEPQDPDNEYLSSAEDHGFQTSEETPPPDDESRKSRSSDPTDSRATRSGVDSRASSRATPRASTRASPAEPSNPRATSTAPRTSKRIRKEPTPFIPRSDQNFRSAHAATPDEIYDDGLPAFHSAFTAGATSEPPEEPPSRKGLPPAPRHWKQLERHPKRKDFEAAAQKGINDLEAKGTSTAVKQTSKPSTQTSKSTPRKKAPMTTTVTTTSRGKSAFQT